MVRIQRFGVIRTATVVAVVYLLAAAIFFIPFALLAVVFRTGSAGSDGSAGLSFIVVAFLIAIFYGVIGWIITAIGCAIYNVAAGWVGGIELRIEAVEPPPPPVSWAPSTTPTPPTPPTLPSSGPNQPPYAG